LSLKIYSANIW